MTGNGPWINGEYRQTEYVPQGEGSETRAFQMPVTSLSRRCKTRAGMSPLPACTLYQQIDKLLE